MVKVITYGTYDLLHEGHIKLLERAKALGDYLIVGIIADDFDKIRGKINVSQSLVERIAAVEATGLADKIIVQEYDGQKIDDIIKYGVDIFTVGSDWEGKFDYLNEYCKVIYLPRTEGVSSSMLRAKEKSMKLGLVGESSGAKKILCETEFVNGVEICGICYDEAYVRNVNDEIINKKVMKFEELIQTCDSVYIGSHPSKHYEQIKYALNKGKHVLCESPISLSKNHCRELFELAQKNKCVLMEAIKTAYSTAYSRLVLMVKSGKIGEVVSVDSTCTSKKNISSEDMKVEWNSICCWGPTAMLPIFQLLGTEYVSKNIYSMYLDKDKNFDCFSKINFTYKNAVASLKIGNGIKSEGELIISGTKGYVYVPAPWWKTDYFEIRYENMEENKRYFYQLNGEGIRYEIVAFLNQIKNTYKSNKISQSVTMGICSIIEDFENNLDVFEIEN